MVEKLGSAAHGIDLTILSGISEQDGQVVKGDNGLTQDGPYAVDAGIEGATQVEYQTLEAAGTDQFANNKRKRTTRPSQNPTATVTYLDIDWDVLNKVVGYEEDETGGATLDQDHKPHISLLTREPLLDGNFLYEAFANATATYQTSTHATDNTEEQDANVQLSLKAYEPIADVFKLKSGKKMPYKKWNSGSKKFDEAKMLQEVFPGTTAKTVDDILKASTIKTSSAGGNLTPGNSGGSTSGTNTGSGTDSEKKTENSH